jgi:hypothetical protein
MPASASAPSSEANKRAAEALTETAFEKLEEAAERFAEIQASLDATTKTRVEKQLGLLEEQMEVGRKQYEDGEFMAARATFSAVIGDASALGAYLRAEQRFNRNYLRLWVDNRFGSFGEEEQEKDDDTDAEVKGESIERSNDSKDGKDGADSKDGEDGEKGEDGKDGSAGTSNKVKINLEL